MILALLIIITAFLLNLFLPWWSIALPGLVFGYLFNKKGLVSFGWGFLAVFLLWAAQTFYIHFANDGILPSRIAEMFGVGSPFVVIYLTGVAGGLVSGLATLTGSLLRFSSSRVSESA